MRNIITIISVLLLSISAIAQPSQYPLMRICYAWDKNTDSWRLGSKQTYGYDLNNNKIYEFTQSWNDTVWENYNVYYFTYDSNGNQTSEYYRFWNSDWGGYWEYGYTEGRSYDGLGRIIYTVTCDEWDCGDDEYYTYDSNGHLIKVLAIYEGTNDYQYIYTYDSSGNLIETLEQSWDGNTWVTNYKETFIITYDSIGRITSKESVGDYKNVYTYDINGKIASQITQKWNGTSWVNLIQEYYTYDSFGQTINHTIQNWNGTTWVITTQDVNNYDTSGI